MPDDSSMPQRRRRRIGCNADVSNETVAKKALMSGSFAETRLDGTRLYHKKIIGTVEQYPEEDAARRSVVGLVSELNTDGRPTNSSTMTVAQLCDHSEQRELAKENSWRSHATKKIYKAYLTRWIRPHWKKYQLAEVRTIQVESWLRGLQLAKSSCAKIRNVMSVLFNHACR